MCVYKYMRVLTQESPELNQKCLYQALKLFCKHILLSLKKKTNDKQLILENLFDE